MAEEFFFQKITSFFILVIDKIPHKVYNTAIVKQSTETSGEENYIMKQSVVALYPGKGWTNVDVDVIVKLQKSWNEEDGEACRIDVYFGRLLDKGQALVVIMNVSSQGCGANHVIDDNCDIWKNFFASTTKEEGNEYYKYLKKHGFTKA